MEVVWKPGVVGSPHALILGISGQGKSVTARNIVRGAKNHQLGSLVFDFHGDMAQEMNGEARVIDVASTGLPFNPFEVVSATNGASKSTALAVADILASVVNLGDIQRTSVYKALKSAFDNNGWSEATPDANVPTMEQFVERLRLEEKNSKGKNAESRLLDITEFDLFKQTATSMDYFSTSEITIFDVSKMGSESLKRAAVAFLLRKIYNEMFLHGISSRLNLMVLVDEAHLMAKDPTIPRLLKEGRKFGVAMVLSSQSLDDFPQEVIDNVGLKIAFRTNNPMSRKVAGFLQGTDVATLANRLEKLSVGEAFISMPGQAGAAKVMMRG